MLILLVLLIVAGIAAYLYRKQIYVAVQEKRLSNTVSKLEDAIAAHELELRDKYLALKAKLESSIRTTKSEIEASKKP